MQPIGPKVSYMFARKQNFLPELEESYSPSPIHPTSPAWYMSINSRKSNSDMFVYIA